MKKFKEVESDRKQSHVKPMKNTVHRTSLLVPVLPGARAEISFLNHFLLKRGIKDIICKVTALDGSGKRLDSESFPISEPRAYQISLNDRFQNLGIQSFIVEFFSAANLFIPFPAVMVNHFGNGFVNSVHAYNRVLNDVFEDESINSQLNKEASIDVRMDDHFDTFVLFASGVQDCHDEVRIELSDERQALAANVPVHIKRLTHSWLSLKELFPGFRTAAGGGAVLKIQQPGQFYFYGRVLAGQIYEDGAFSANHSYYDCVDNPEYWEDSSVSFRNFPFIPGFQNGVRIYPITSPGTLKVWFRVHGLDGKVLAESEPQKLVTPGAKFIDFSVNALMECSHLKEIDVSAFSVFAAPDGGCAPTRIGTQLIYGRGKLEASINFQMLNENIYQPARQKNIVWGQTILGAGFDSWLGITSSHSTHESGEVHMTFYSTQGELKKISLVLKNGSALRLNIATELKDTLSGLDVNKPNCIWYTMETELPRVIGHTLTTHKDSFHCTGEHSF